METSKTGAHQRAVTSGADNPGIVQETGLRNDDPARPPFGIRHRVDILGCFGRHALMRTQVVNRLPIVVLAGILLWFNDDVLPESNHRLKNVLTDVGRKSPTFEFDNAPITIGDSVWIATRATILRGVHIADGATVGAGALVTRNVATNETILAATSRTVDRA